MLEVKSCGSFASKSGLTSKKSYRKTDGNQPRERVHEHRMGSKDGHMDGSFKDGLKLAISDDHIHPKKTFYCEVLVFTKLILGVQGLDHSINGQT